jgi:hypothetical protein
MMTENRRCLVKLRNYHDQGIGTMIRKLKIEERTFEDRIEVSRLFDDFVWDNADARAKGWPTLPGIHGHQN